MAILKILKLVFAFSIALSAIMGAISPIFFNFWLIPKIEKRLGQKLEYMPIWNMYPFGKFFMAHSEVSLYIVIRYLALKIKDDPNTIRISSRINLTKTNYDIRKATREEIIFSFFTWVSILYFLIAGILLWILST